MSDEKNAPNPFQIGLVKNDDMGCYEVHATIGGIKDAEQAKVFAEVLAEWLTAEGGWKSRVN